MNLRCALFLLAATLLSLSSAGCGTLYSWQSYGSPTRGHVVSQGASRADVLANMGSPNSVYKSNDTEVFVYKGLTGKNWCGFLSHFRRTDTVVVMDSKGIVLTAAPVDVAKGFTLISPPWWDATHPVRTEDAFFDPENYNVETESGGK